MDQDTLRLSMAISLLAALISLGNIANAETNSQSTTPAEINGSVTRSAFTLAVVNREPKQKITRLSNNQRHIYYFSELKGMTGQNVIHRWLYNGQTMAEL
ncbi:MAG TPA: hypothetical protein ENJ65_04710, partial [Candidatus Tenderia electrophaga]|nr:hypothetical protein [Candidatus Tenderia electrophaga]